MITNMDGDYVLECDFCKNQGHEYFKTFEDAIAYKKAHGWRSVKIGNEWYDKCPMCQPHKSETKQAVNKNY